jgi:hypothetical protein
MVTLQRDDVEARGLISINPASARSDWVSLDFNSRLACYIRDPLVYGPGQHVWPGVVIIGIDGKITYVPGIGGGPPVVIENGGVVGSSEDKD